jgi:lipoprotein Spr
LNPPAAGSGIRYFFKKRLSLPVPVSNNEMKNQFILLLLMINLAGCEVFRPATRPTDNLSDGSNEQASFKKTEPEFIQNISTASAGTSVNSTKTSLYRPASVKTTVPTAGNGDYSPLAGNGDYDPLQFKYAILTNSPVEELTNQRLLVFMDQWYGTPYHYGGSSKDGIDCSAFTCQLISNVYNVNQLPRMSADQYKATRRISKKDLREGDLVFFHTMGKGHKVTHVGVYLYNNRFVHASIAGVQISDLGEGYYLHHYVGAGRVPGNDKTY